MLLGANVELLAGDTTAIVTSQAQDSQGNVYPLSVEYIGKVAQFEWITQVIVKLPDALTVPSDLSISLNVRGSESNKALVAVR